MNQLIGLRFFLSFQLLLLHTMPKSMYKNISFAIDSAYVSTSFFIILSGFVLSMIYSNKEIVNFKLFFVLRVIKILPLAVICSLFLFLISNYQILKGESVYLNLNVNDYLVIGNQLQIYFSFLIQILALDGWNIFYLALNTPAWTLSTFFLGYLIFPYILKMTKNLSINYILKCLLICYIILIFFPFLSLVLNFPNEDISLFSNLNVSSGFLHRFPPLRLLEFLIGILFFRILELIKVNVTVNTTIFLIFFFLSLFILHIFLPRNLMHNGIFIPFQLFFIYVLYTDNSWVKKFLSNEYVVLLGKASLALYLLHIPLWGIRGFIIKRILIIINQEQHFNLVKNNYFIYFFSIIIVVFISLLVQKYFVNSFYYRFKAALLNKV